MTRFTPSHDNRSFDPRKPRRLRFSHQQGSLGFGRLHCAELAPSFVEGHCAEMHVSADFCSDQRLRMGEGMGGRRYGSKLRTGYARCPPRRKRHRGHEVAIPIENDDSNFMRGAEAQRG
jgi:hypothetical protein